MKRFNRRQTHYRRSVLLLILIMAAIFYIGRLHKVVEIQQIRADDTQVKLVSLETEHKAVIEENAELKGKLDRSAKIQTSDSTKAVAMEYIKKYFPEPKVQAQVMKIVKCESNFNNLALNKNKNGTVDKGVFQINSIHAKAFQKVTGFDYEVGSNDFDANTKYARYIYDTQGHFNAWVCSRLI